jgi:hypothetical protein
LDCQLLILAGTVATKNTKCISKSLPNSLPVRLAGGLWLVLVCSERKVLLSGRWWLVCFERKVLLAGGL